MKRKTGKNIFIRLIQLVLVVVIVWQLIHVARYYMDLNQAKNRYDTIQGEVAQALDEEEKVSDIDDALTPGRGTSLRAANRVVQLLKEKNPDAVGYIKIDRAGIEYPMVQGRNNDEYLYQSFDNEYSIAGSIFMDANNERDFSDENTIIYGHHMKDGSMFHNLSAWRRGEYNGERIEIEIYGENGPERYLVYSVYNVPQEEPYRQINFSDENEFADFVEKTWYDSETQFDADPTGAEKIITLSTCTPNQEEFRIAVHAVLIPENNE